MGYKTSLLTLDASHYLVPQKRKRIILIGSIFPHFLMVDPHKFASDCYSIDIEKYKNGAKYAIGDLGQPTDRGGVSYYNTMPVSDFAAIMRRENNEQFVTLHEYPRMSDTDKEIVRHIPPGGNYNDIPDEIATGRMLRIKKTGGRTTTYARLHPEMPSFTVNTYFRRPNVGSNFHYSEDRLITPREAMRFQSIPDRFRIASGSQDKRNALIGNAVPPLLAHAIAYSLKLHILKNSA